MTSRNRIEYIILFSIREVEGEGTASLDKSKGRRSLQSHGRGCDIELPFVSTLPYNSKEFGMAHKKIDAFHPSAFLQFRCFSMMIFSLAGECQWTSQTSITVLICTRSSIAMMLRWKKLEFGGSYVGAKFGVDGGENILEGYV